MNKNFKNSRVNKLKMFKKSQLVVSRVAKITLILFGLVVILSAIWFLFGPAIWSYLGSIFDSMSTIWGVPSG